MSELPEPLTPPDADLRDFQFMPVDVVRLRDSGIAVEATGEEFRAALLLWCAAWHQVPAGSLPDNDMQLSMLAGYGRVVAEWLKVKDGALRGFVLCSDGRLYHPVVAEKANEAWRQKCAYAEKREADRRRKDAARRSESKVQSDGKEEVSGGQTNMSGGQAANVRKMSDTVDAENAHKGQGEDLKGEGKKEDANASLASECARAFEMFNLTAERCQLPRAQNLNDDRKRKLRQRLSECGGLPGWEVALAKLEASDWCCGRNGSWRADLDFLLQAKSFTKLMEGSYDNRIGATSGKPNVLRSRLDAIAASAGIGGGG